MTLSAWLVTLLVGSLLPLAVAFITKSSASVGLKQFVAAFVAAVTGLIVTSTMADGTAVISKEAALLALGAFFSSQVAYGRLYRPHNLNAKVAPNFGLGAPVAA